MKKIADKGATEAFIRAHVAYQGDECVLWPFAASRSGYGLATIGGYQRSASRWMCILAHGEPPTPKHEAAHNCGNRRCVNPRHLRWDTPKGNQADKLIHGTHNRGERNGKTTLTADDVRAIRQAPPDLAAIMERFGISKGCASKIRSGQRWSHVQ